MPRSGRLGFGIVWVTALLLSTLVGAPIAVATGERAVPGAAGIGDPLLPFAGNGGYDVDHYDLALTIEPGPGRITEAVARIEAIATEALSAFNLDFRGLDVASVTVDGRAADIRRSDAEMTVIPPTPIAAGASFTVEVRYAGTPERVRDPLERGWWATAGTVYVVGEPGGAETWYPVNGHPADRATYTLSLTVPVGYDVFAGGTKVGETATDRAETTVWQQDDAVASYLVSFIVAPDLEFIRATGPCGLPIVHAVPPDLAPEKRAVFDRVPAMVAYFERLFGPFPADRFGGVVVDGFGAALETQEMVVYGRQSLSEETVAHELAHHWFGNSVGLRRWQDIWLNEGFARYAELLWIEYADGVAARDAALARLAERVSLPRPGGQVVIGRPASNQIFAGDVYARGALTLHALRRELGDRDFFRLLQAWHRRYAGANATTDDFIALAETIADRDLGDFFERWLFRAEPPRPLLGPPASSLSLREGDALPEAIPCEDRGP